MPIDPAKLKQLRESRGLTQTEAAHAADMPQPHYARLESGRNNSPTLDTAERIARALRVKVDRLLR